MRVVVVHNPGAGREDHSPRDVLGQIRRAGHAVVVRLEDADGLRDWLAARASRADAADDAGGRDGRPDAPCDAVVAAGGDGTVGRVAGVLAGTGLPLAILALGTANNLARTFGVDGPPGPRIAGWDGGARRGFDALRVSAGGAPVGRSFESVGLGAFPRVMRRAEAVPVCEEPEAQLRHEIELLRRGVADAPLERYALDADGEDLSGGYLLVEALNIPFLGPRLPLAARAEPDDGRLDLVLAGEDDRGPLLAAIERLGRGEPPDLALPSRRAARIAVTGGARRGHRDGELLDVRATPLVLDVERCAVQVLVPR